MERGDELQGKMRKDYSDERIAHTLLEVDKEKLEKTKMLDSAVSNNITSFTPDMMFDHLTSNYRSAKQIMGERLIRELTGYDPGYIDRNVNVPEFKRELKERIKQNLDRLKNENLIDGEGNITDEAEYFYALSLLSEELDELEGKGLLGEYESKKISAYGERNDTRNYKSGDKYKDIALKQSAKKAIRRGHSTLDKNDLIVSTRKAHGLIEVIYALDASGSMKGDKIRVAKKAGIALAYKAISGKDKAGVVVFNSNIVNEITPGNDFQSIVKELSLIKTSGETDIALCIEHAINLFSNSKAARHIVLLTDALQTRGKQPEKEVLEKISAAANSGITITVVGISLDEKGESLARKIVDVCNGTLYVAKSLNDIDSIILEDYHRAKSSAR